MINRVIRLFDAFSLGITLLLLLIVAFNIAARAIFDLSSGSINLMIPGAIELSRYALLLIIFAALPRASTQGMVSVDLLSNRFSASIQKNLTHFWLLLMAAFMAILVWLFTHKALLTFSRGDASQDLEMPLFYFYALISIACVATTLSCLAKVFSNEDAKP